MLSNRALLLWQMLGEPADQYTPAELTPAAERRVDQLVGDLADRDRRVLELRIDGGKTYMQIAAEVGCSAGRIGQLTRRALRRLRTTEGATHRQVGGWLSCERIADGGYLWDVRPPAGWRFDHDRYRRDPA